MRHEVLVTESGGDREWWCQSRDLPESAGMLHCAAKRCGAASTSFVGEAMTWWRKKKEKGKKIQQTLGAVIKGTSCFSFLLYPGKHLPVLPYKETALHQS